MFSTILQYTVKKQITKESIAHRYGEPDIQIFKWYINFQTEIKLKKREKEKEREK